MDEEKLVKDLKDLFNKYVDTMSEDNSSATLRVMSDIWFYLEDNDAFIGHNIDTQVGGTLDG